MQKAVVSVSMEVALEGSANYAGGLGVLEADKFYGAARLGLPYILIAPFYPNGYVDWDFVNKTRVFVEIRHRHSTTFLSKLIYIGSLEARRSDGRFLAEADLFEYSYGSAKAILYRVKRPTSAARLFRYLYRHHIDECTYYITAAAISSEIIKRIAKETQIHVVDVQEAHLAFVPYLLPKEIRTRFVTHTPGPWGHPKLCKEAEEVLGISLPNVKTMTEAAMEVVEKVFAVSRKHFEITKTFFPKYANKMSYVTNAVDVEKWQRVGKELKSAEELAKAHENLRNEYRSMIRALSGKSINDRIIVAWTRRITKYKRPYFIEWLLEENNDLKDRVFVVVSGKPHPNDQWGRELAAIFTKFSRVMNNFFYYPSYDTNFAYYTLSSVDLLLFTPFSCWEASGTSMMKAGVNGVPTLSSRDGASLELIEDNVNGWFFGKELDQFIDLESDFAKKVDEEDYTDFLKKLEKIVSIFDEDKEKYYEVAFNAYKTFTQSADIRRLLRQYYGDMVEASKEKSG
ncbi:glycogen/starch/alpha-glucan phosphorylase [Ignisphaera sp. 4213-co]|uniref:Glycogen/starch/alpha-glucan phosphorylase n=1 Tax=Ignisphaera cupida TaxID=3050454 RepID=A0ABD4Z3U4_9CREN|nr:glycogen/starch/alpha-glucan phosphorylase [Ignisphaera sp. 4213-co]MDK6027869.1 glycogen/starch/alpha-glucan phosphorylase [Ignisphaera sp. 4213-co]